MSINIKVCDGVDLDDIKADPNKALWAYDNLKRTRPSGKSLEDLINDDITREEYALNLLPLFIPLFVFFIISLIIWIACCCQCSLRACCNVKCCKRNIVENPYSKVIKILIYLRIQFMYFQF